MRVSCGATCRRLKAISKGAPEGLSITTVASDGMSPSQVMVREFAGFGHPCYSLMCARSVLCTMILQVHRNKVPFWPGRITAGG